MSFEIFSRKVQWKGSPAISLTKMGLFSFNKTASTRFQKEAVENILLLWDKEKRLIGVRPITKKDNRAYKLYWSKRGDGCSFSALTFLKFIGFDISETRSMPILWDEQEGIFKIEIPEEYFKKEGLVTPIVKTNEQEDKSTKPPKIEDTISNEDLVCKICGRTCKSPSGLHNHMRLAHSTKATNI